MEIDEIVVDEIVVDYRAFVKLYFEMYYKIDLTKYIFIL
jgi:hypothetical protein